MSASSSPVRSPLTGITYRAVVKYPVDAKDGEKRRALREGLQEIVAELVEEHGYTLDQIEQVLEDARWTAEETLTAIGRTVD